MQQTEVRDFAASVFRSAFKNLPRLLPLFDNTAIQTRYLSQPLDWYKQIHAFPEANSLYEKTALSLAETATRQALSRAEVCSLTYQSSDFSKANLVAMSLFGDGGAAAVLQMSGDGPEILGQHSTLFENSEEVMGWDFIESGLKVRFSRDIPTIVRQRLPALLQQACAKWGIERADLRHFVAHPGGAKVLAAYAESLDLSSEHSTSAFKILAEYGNMPSASVLFVLEHFLATTPQRRLRSDAGPGAGLQCRATTISLVKTIADCQKELMAVSGPKI